MKDLKGRWAFISGASRGIGYGVALFMADKGCNLILHGRKKEHLEKVREEAKKKGVEVLTVACELADQKAVEEMLEEIDSFGKDVDILFNNAGIQVTYRNEYLKTPAIDFYESFAVNATAPMMICYHFLPSMMK